MPRGRSALPALISTSKVAKSAICSRDLRALRGGIHVTASTSSPLRARTGKAATMRRSRPTATLTCRRPPATEAPLCFATVIALSSSDIAPEKKVYWG